MNKVARSQWRTSLLLQTSAVLALLIAGIPSLVHSQTPPFWRDLQAGPYAVGFRFIYKYDYSRSWKAKEDANGYPESVDRGRPIRVSVWYPAKIRADSPRMLYRDYMPSTAKSSLFADLNAALDKRDAGNLHDSFKGDDYDKLLLTRMAAAQNAGPRSGSFPLIIYSAGLNNSSQDNVVLCEYLASHGYVVITVPQLAHTSLDVNLRFQNPIDLETQALDLQQAIAAVHDFPNVNHSRLGLIGYSVGGVVALNLAMRNSDVAALVTLDPTFGVTPFVKLATNSPYYAPTNLRIPWMHLHRVEPATDFAIFSSLKYSDRYRLELAGLSHQDFSSYPLLLPQRASAIKTDETAARGHRSMCRYILNFFEAYLKSESKALALINRNPTASADNVAKFERRPAIAPPPTEQKFLGVLERDGMEAALKLYNASRARDPEQPIFSETFLNQLGYRFIREKRLAEAIEVLKLNTEAYPASANVYDSLGEAYLLSGNKDMAIKFYEKSIELNPGNKEAIEVVRKLKANP